jgi:hypothetical protein
MDGGRALDVAEREMEEKVRGRFPGGGLQRLMLLQDGGDPETGPGELRACRHFDKAR